MSSSNRRLAIGSRLASMRSAASTKLPADTRRTPLLSIARALTKMGLCDELFHTATGTAFADIPVNNHRETWPIRSSAVPQLAWLTYS